MKLLGLLVLVVTLALPMAASARSATAAEHGRQVAQARKVQKHHVKALAPRASARADRGSPRVVAKQKKARSARVLTRQEKIRLQHAKQRPGTTVLRASHGKPSATPRARQKTGFVRGLR